MEGLLSLGGYDSIYATAASAFSPCYHRIGVLVNPTCDGIRGSVGAGDRMGQRRRQLQAVDGLIEPFEDAGADARVKQAAGLLK